jgi:hypothetical protein
MRFFKILITLFLLNSTINAEDLDKLYTFIGIQTSYTKYDDKDAPTIGLKYGKQNSLWRTALIYNYAVNSDDTYHSLIMQVDRGVLIDMFEDKPFKPYIGFSLGVMQHKNDYIKDRGYLLGGNIGINYVIDNYFDLDLGYRFLTTSKMKNLSNRQDLSISIHYYFD